ncbi:Protein of unknown function [Pyronema omphalodes CBS 100304]|uniref:Secreted protein n=1 Tax=Pyronema omphalodes (strain CBS 100304) TaxID=1076935 RepID=U4KXQ3_PYROM|nr:Protein of unknown function [Pyronema omphalodes CBS 100304]
MHTKSIIFLLVSSLAFGILAIPTPQIGQATPTSPVTVVELFAQKNYKEFLLRKTFSHGNPQYSGHYPSDLGCFKLSSNDIKCNHAECTDSKE